MKVAHGVPFSALQFTGLFDCNFQANPYGRKSLGIWGISFLRVYAATQGAGLVYTRSHLVRGLSSKSLIRRKIAANSLWHSNCQTKWERGAGRLPLPIGYE